MKPITAIPPTTPPAIAPALTSGEGVDGLALGVGVGVELWVSGSCNTAYL